MIHQNDFRLIHQDCNGNICNLFFEVGLHLPKHKIDFYLLKYEENMLSKAVTLSHCLTFIWTNAFISDVTLQRPKLIT